MEHHTATLFVKLTPNETLEYGRQLAQKLERIEQINDELATTQSVLKGSIKQATLDAQRLSKLIREGREEREVRISEGPDYSAREIVTVREDTFEEIARRPMRDDEIEKHFQKTLFTQPVVSDEPVSENETSEHVWTCPDHGPQRSPTCPQCGKEQAKGANA